MSNAHFKSSRFKCCISSGHCFNPFKPKSKRQCIHKTIFYLCDISTPLVGVIFKSLFDVRRLHWFGNTPSRLYMSLIKGAHVFFTRLPSSWFRLDLLPGCIYNPANYLNWSLFTKIVNNLHLRCLKGFWICLWMLSHGEFLKDFIISWLFFGRSQLIWPWHFKQCSGPF